MKSIITQIGGYYYLMDQLSTIGQIEFEIAYSEIDFKEIFGRNYR